MAMKNAPFIGDFPNKTSMHRGFSSQPCLMTPEGIDHEIAMAAMLSPQRSAVCQGITPKIRSLAVSSYYLGIQTYLYKQFEEYLELV